MLHCNNPQKYTMKVCVKYPKIYIRKLQNRKMVKWDKCAIFSGTWFILNLMILEYLNIKNNRCAHSQFKSQ